MSIEILAILERLPGNGAGEQTFLLGAALVAITMLLWDTVEVGRNDAANILNAILGARILTRERALVVAGIGVVVGAIAASPVIETARKGIFDPTALTMQMALSVYVAVYIVDTILLYGYSAFGMPVSTTASLVFALLGGSFAVGAIEQGNFSVVNWATAGNVVLAILCSIAITGICAFFIQRMARGVIHDRATNLPVLLAHGGWLGGAMMTGLTYFLLVKGMKQFAFVKHINENVLQAYGPGIVVVVLWAIYAGIIHALLVIFGRAAARRLFPVLAIIGTLAMALAFGQNDLANCASPGLAALHLIWNWDVGIVEATEAPIPTWTLALCGCMLVIGMATKNALRVTKAQVHAGSMAHQVRLWAPRWCIRAARVILRLRGHQPVLAPLPKITPAGGPLHYDPLRACVILAVSASVIATASGFGLPVSTTYVAFAAVVATGAADRIFQRGDAELKLARTIWVVFSWFAAAAIAALAAGVVCMTVYRAGAIGIVIAVACNLLVRRVVKKRADAQEERVREATRERRHPEWYAEEYED